MKLIKKITTAVATNYIGLLSNTTSGQAGSFIGFIALATSLSLVAFELKQAISSTLKFKLPPYTTLLKTYKLFGMLRAYYNQLFNV